MKQERLTPKKAYILNWTENYKRELANTIFTEENQEMWIKLAAENEYSKRAKDIETIGDGLMYGIIDSKRQANKIKEEIKIN